MKTFLFLMVSIVIMSGCTLKKNNGSSVEPGQTASDSRDLVAYEDKARGVVCYRVSGRDGLSCIKIENR